MLGTDPFNEPFMIKCLSLIVLLIAAGCNRPHAAKPPQLMSSPQGTRLTNSVTLLKPRAITADDLRRAGVAGDLSSDEVHSINLRMKNMPRFVTDKFGDCIKEAPQSSHTKLVELKDSELEDIAQLLRRRFLTITRPPVIRGCECATAKVLKIESWENDRSNDFVLVKPTGSPWEVMIFTGRRR